MSSTQRRESNLEIWLLDKKSLQKIINESSTLANVLEKLNLRVHTHYYNELKERINNDNLSLDLLNSNRKIFFNKHLENFRKKLPNNLIFIENSKVQRNIVKKRIINEMLIPYKCRDCNNEGNWNNKKLSLHLEHINGNWDDNRLENLCFLCPNCHSQTPTYCGNKNKKLKEYMKCSCGNDIKFKKSKLCRNCAASNQKKKFEVSKEELEKLIFVNEMPFTKIGKMFGVSDNAIRKRCKKFGIKY